MARREYRDWPIGDRLNRLERLQAWLMAVAMVQEKLGRADMMLTRLDLAETQRKIKEQKRRVNRPVRRRVVRRYR